MHYHFITPQRFHGMREGGELLESAEVHGNYYGTPREPVERALASGLDVLFDIDWQGAAQLREKPISGPLHAWVLRVARNAIVDHYRARGRGETAIEDVAVDDPETERVERAGLLASFRAFVHALPPEQREAVLLTEYEGLTQKELAERLGIPVSTVKSRVQRGRAQLRELLDTCCAIDLDARGHVVDVTPRAVCKCGAAGNAS